MKTLLFHDDLFLQHDPGAGHVESPQRLASVLTALERLPAGVEWARCIDATREQVLRIHDADYLDLLQAHAGHAARLDVETAMSPDSFAAAMRAAGAAVGLADALLDRRADNGFALVRPPGHHAEVAKAMGFCLLNNVAIAAAHARSRGIERVAIVDWDVHHGNGTQHQFEDRPDVLFLSTHRYPFYPGTGAATEAGLGAGLGMTINAPLPPGMGDGDYGAVFHRLFQPVLEQFRPGLVIVSAGFDAHADDPLGGMEVGVQGFAGLCSLVRDVALAVEAPLMLVLEGGYDLPALGASVRASIEVLAGARAPLPDAPTAAGARVIDEVLRVHRPHWEL